MSHNSMKLTALRAAADAERSKDREEDDNARAKGQVVWHEQTMWQYLREVQPRPVAPLWVV